VSIRAKVGGTGKRAKKRQPPPRSRRRSLQDWPVSARLIAVILVALAIGMVYGGLRVADAVGGADQFGRVTQLATLGEQGTIMVQDLQNERDETAAVIGGASPALLKPLYSATNTAAAQFSADASALGGGFPANIRASVATALTDAQNVASVRNLAKSEGGPTTVITDYADPIQDTISLTGLIAQGISDSVLSNDVRTLGSLSQLKEEVTEQRALLVNSLTQGFSNSGVDLAVNTAAAQQQLDLAAFQTTATSDQQTALAPVFSSTQASSAANIEDFMVSDSDPFADIGNLGISQKQAPTLWYSQMSYEINQLHGVELGIAQNIVARAQSLQSGAQQSAITTALVTLAVLLLVLLAAFIVARSLVQPLRRLRAGALNIASVQLPERVRLLSESPESPTTMEVTPINVVSEDEIGQVARAFDQVHAEAVRLASEQALLRSSFNATFVNLSRRLQSLIERLARTIDGLEQTEEDAGRLSSLFSMDHLVTRMRRNSENLLLLAGHESPRKWSEAIPLADVARAASSEIEQYNRVTLSIPLGVSVVGQAVTDVSHLLAELIENATMFSPKDTQVRVSMQELSSGGVMLEIIDKGIGVSETRLTDMNWRLDNPPTMDVSVSRHMGLFAVARLAERHRVRVRLRLAPPQGLSALVWLPESIITRTSRYYSGPDWSTHPSSAQAVAGTRPAVADRAIDEAPAALAQSGNSYGATGGNGYGAAGGNGGNGGNGYSVNAGSALPGRETRTASGWFRGQGAAGDPAPDWAVHGVPGESPTGSSASVQMSSAGLPVRTSRASQPRGTQPGPPAGPAGLSDLGGQGGSSGPGSQALPTRGGDPSRTLPSRAPGPGPGPGPRGPGGGSHPLPVRSPDQARSRLAGFQRGTRRAEEKSGQPGQFGEEPGAGERSER
jgi:signal transduction histidine kinase